MSASDIPLTDPLSDPPVVDIDGNQVYLSLCPVASKPLPDRRPGSLPSFRNFLGERMGEDIAKSETAVEFRTTELELLFKPRGVAVLGASRNPDKLGHLILKNIIEGGYEGRIFPVNPGAGNILGLKSYASVEEVEGQVDIAIIVLPRVSITDAIHQCGRKGVHFLVVITSGFSEIGDIAGERELVATASSYGMRILGPNIFGIYSSAAKLNATFGPGEIRSGNIAMITQSGALGVALMGKTVVEKLGLSAVVSIGNKADISEVDLLEYVSTDAATRVILIYLEGTKQGRELLRILGDVVPRKPVVMIKAGRSAKGARAAASHTGSMAGSDMVFDAAMRQSGVLRAQDVNEAFAWLRTLSTQPLPRGEKVIIITNGGGVGVMATDAAEKYGLSLLDDMSYLEKTFGKDVPPFGSTKNPIDLTGQAREDDYVRVLARALKEETIRGVIALNCELAITDPESLSRKIIATLREGPAKPVAFALIGGEKMEKCIDLLHEAGIPAYGYPEAAVSALTALFRWWSHRNEEKERIEPLEVDFTAARSVIERARRMNRLQLLEVEAKEILEIIGLKVPRAIAVRGLEECLRAAETIGYPVVLKVISPDIVHKTEAGGIKIGLADTEEVAQGYKSIMANCRRKFPRAVIRGISVNEMVRGGIETIVGASTDPSFGPVVMFGLGGIYVEVLKDVVFRITPVTRREARKMIEEIESFPLLLGARGEKVKDIDAIIDAVYRIGVLVDVMRDIAELDVNPLAVMERGKGAWALDARIRLHPQ
jgi:acetyltransferase